jgi:hypothetical protein
MAERWAEVREPAAAFFFARWRVGGGLGKSPFPTIAYQLALHVPQLRAAIGLMVEGDPAPHYMISCLIQNELDCST